MVHKGGLAGPVIATAILSSTKNGATEIKLTQTHQTLLQTHVSGFFSGKTFFEIDGKKFHWKGQSALVEDDTGVCLAVYKAKSFESEDRKLGTLLVTAQGQQYVDIIVVSTLVEQERNDESEFDVQFCINDADVYSDWTSPRRVVTCFLIRLCLSNDGHGHLIVVLVGLLQPCCLKKRNSGRVLIYLTFFCLSLTMSFLNCANPAHRRGASPQSQERLTLSAGRSFLT